MIKGITQSGKYVMVSGNSGAVPYVSPGAQSAGMIRYNTSTQNVEVYDGNNWQLLGGGFSSIGLTPEAENLLDWAKRKRDEELEYERLASENKAVKIAMENVEKAKQQLTITAKLARDNYHEHGEVMEQASP
jgi:hypothetical protein